MFSRILAPSSHRLIALTVFVCLAGAGSGCAKWKRKKAADAGASSASSPSSASTASTLSGTPSSTPALVDAALLDAEPPDPLSPADRAIVDRTQASLLDVDTLVKKGVVTDPARAGEGDINTQCATIEGWRARLETLPDADGELKKLAAETRRLCSFEVPILNSNLALHQASLSPSQASHRLMCGLAQKDFDKARVAKPNDRRVFDLGQRLGTTCR